MVKCLPFKEIRVGRYGVKDSCLSPSGFSNAYCVSNMAFVASRSSMRFELLRDGLLRAFVEGCEVGWGTLEALRR